MNARPHRPALPARAAGPSTDRRGLFRLGAGTLAAGVVGAGLAGGRAAAGTATAAAAARRTGAAPTAGRLAALPASGVFDLGVPSEEYLRERLLHETHHALQGFSFDTVNRRLFVAQLTNGTDGDDLCINQVSAAGAVLGSMHLANAGHGVSIPAEPVGSTTYLWVEYDSDDASRDGRGTALLRFPWTAGTTPAGTRHFRGSSGITAAVDPVNQNLMVRRDEDGGKVLTVYPLADVGGTPLARVRQPSTPETFQGYTFLGDHAYLLEGDGHEDPSESLFNSYVSTVDLTTGAVVDRQITRAGRTLAYREPEGMAIHTTEGGSPRLVMGFASRHGQDRRASLYYKPM